MCSVLGDVALRSKTGAKRKEDISEIERNIPVELYKLKPGQVTFYVSPEGVNQGSLSKISEAYTYLNQVHQQEVKWNIISTDNELLIGQFAGRSEREANPPYKVVVGSWDTIAGFASQYFGEDLKKIQESVPEKEYQHISITGLEPITVSIDPDKCPRQEQQESSDDSDSSLEVKMVKPEKGSKEEKAFISRMERKLEKVFRECAIYDISLDVNKIHQKVIDSQKEEALKSTVDYKLILDIETVKDEFVSFCTKCDIYVAEGEDYKLNFTAVQKAIYLSFLLYEDGIRLLDTFEDFRLFTQKIYKQLPDDSKCVKTANGIMDEGCVIPDVYAKTLNGQRLHIRNAIDAKISNPMIAQEFAIEGFKDKEFSIARSAPELRAQIKEAFGL